MFSDNQTATSGYVATWIKERVKFLCSVLVSAQVLLFRHMD